MKNSKLKHYIADQQWPPIFSDLGMYLLSHDENGKRYLDTGLTRKQKTIRMYQNQHLCEGLRFSQPNGFPVLERYNGTVDFIFIPFTKRLKNNGKNRAVHFFIDDFNFIDRLDRDIGKVTMELSKFGAVFAPDYSLYSDVPELFIKLAIFKRQLYAAYWQQKCGFNVIPVAGLPRADALEYAFEGIPHESVIGYCGTGHNISKASRDLWLGALYELEARIKPTHILIYGDKERIPGLKTKVTFIPDFITAKLRKL